MAAGKYKRETALTSEEADRFADLVYEASKRLRRLSESDEDRKLAEELENMMYRLWHVKFQGRPHRMGNSAITVGEALAIREKDGEAKMLWKLSGLNEFSREEEVKDRLISRATFYRRLKVLKAYAVETGEDLNQIEFWTGKA